MMEMILWAALLLAPCCFGYGGALDEPAALERIETCSTKCSQGLHCRTRPGFWFLPQCQKPTDISNTLSALQNIGLSTVMRCEGRQRCFLHLRVKVTLRITESIQGLFICTQMPMMLQKCRLFSISKSLRQNSSEMQVEIENDCMGISPNQQVQVKVQTSPNYCGGTLSSTYFSPDCSSDDLRSHVPECITGRLSYEVNLEKKEIGVTVTDMLEDHNYYLRLCYNDYICVGADANALIKMDQEIKSATLSFSRPLPCLCIQGWSDVTDASRIQVCPFRERLEELWYGIAFDPLESSLSWEPLCPVDAVVTMCQKGKDDVCEDLPDSLHNVSREKIIFSKVDPHPELCLKFTAGHQFWTRCPFVGGQFQVWEVASERHEGREELTMLSQVAATFSVGLCVKSAEGPECHLTETRIVQVEGNTVVALNLTDLCLENSCIHVKRLDVKYAATFTHCVEQCDFSPAMEALPSSRAAKDLTWVITPIGIILSALIFVALVLHIVLTVYQRRKQARKQSGCAAKEQGVSSPEFVVPVFPQQSAAGSGLIIPDSPPCGKSEKDSLLS